MRGKKVASTAITITFTITVDNTNVQLQFQSVTSRPFITFQYIPHENQYRSAQRKKKQVENQEHFISYRSKSIYLFIQQLSYRANTTASLP